MTVAGQLTVPSAVAIIVGALIVGFLLLVLILRDKPRPIRARFGVFFERIEPREDEPEPREFGDLDDDTLEIPPRR